MGRRIALRWWIYTLIALSAVGQLRQAAGQTPSANTRTNTQVRDKASNLLVRKTQLLEMPITCLPIRVVRYCWELLS